MIHKKVRGSLLIAFLLCILSTQSIAQRVPSADLQPDTSEMQFKGTAKKIYDMLEIANDTNYIIDLSDLLTVRVYGSKDFIQYRLADNNYSNKVIYEPNNTFDIGIGASYHIFSINAAISAPYLNTFNKYGKTRSFDASTHFYFPKVTIDLYGGFYKGYYISDANNYVLINTKQTYIRPDIHTNSIGLNLQYVVNSTKFSYIGSFEQVQFQKKNAGSIIFGAGIYTGFVSSDSSVIPHGLTMPDFFRNNDFNKSNIYSLALSAGYAYTVVIHQNYFISASLTLGAGGNYMTIANTHTNASTSKLGLLLNTDSRAAAGYNSTYYYVALLFSYLDNKYYTPIAGTRQDFVAGNLRLVLAKRFKLNKTNAIDKVLNKVF
ncbi:MAG: DUF4421 family protein [Taibaiella sp.]|nr:DUF4421 family protein [Taibaiella sp.]